MTASGYGAAILELAKAEGQLEKVESELSAVAQAVASNAELRSALTDPQLPYDRKHGIIDDLIGGRASSLTVGLVQLIISQNRASELPAIARSLIEASAASRDLSLIHI